MTYLIHHGRLGQRWGVQNGPPYPLGMDTAKEQKQYRKDAKRLTSLQKRTDRAERKAAVSARKMYKAAYNSKSDPEDAKKFNKALKIQKKQLRLESKSQALNNKSFSYMQKLISKYGSDPISSINSEAIAKGRIRTQKVMIRNTNYRRRLINKLQKDYRLTTNDLILSDTYSDELVHTGVAADKNPPGRGSGRYPRGSGKRPFQMLEKSLKRAHSKRAKVKEMRRKNKEKEQYYREVKKNKRALTDKDIDDMIRRLRKEKELNDLLAENTDAGKSAVKKVLAESGKKALVKYSEKTGYWLLAKVTYDVEKRLGKKPEEVPTLSSYLFDSNKNKDKNKDNNDGDASKAVSSFTNEVLKANDRYNTPSYSNSSSKKKKRR